MENIMYWDIEMFKWINQTLYSSDLASVMALMRNRFVWIPLYVMIVTWVITRFNLRAAFYLILFILSGVVLTDLCSSRVFKNYVKRIRPCMEASMVNVVNIKAPCRYSYSFPSSHAANHFGLATMLVGLFKNRMPKWAAVALYTWAALISFAQVYVGLHYPLDIIGGALLGVLLIRIYFGVLWQWGGLKDLILPT